ncbi:MAG: arginase family protein [Pseudomonadota bacterium]
MFTRPLIPFFGAELDVPLRDTDIAVFGAPHGTPYKSQSNAPFADAANAFRQALDEDRRWGWDTNWDFDLGGPLLDGRNVNVSDLGNLETTELDGAKNRALIRQAASDCIAACATPIMIGGDDSTPIPFIEGLFGLGPVTVLQIDAHIDWRHERDGETHGYSSTMKRISEMPHVERIIQFGARGIGSARKAEVQDAHTWGAKIVTAREALSNGIRSALSDCSPGTRFVISLDCDGLDAGIMPAVMAPTPGGLSYTHAIDLIGEAGRIGTLAGFDIVEFVPGRDPNGVAALTAARIVANAIGVIARGF